MFLLSLLVPAPNGSIVADADQNGTVPAQTGLSDGSAAFGMAQEGEFGVDGVVHVQVPNVGLATLVSQREVILLLIHTESNKPEREQILYVKNLCQKNFGFAYQISQSL